MTTSVIDRLRQPEYTGSNRCLPCTATNVVIAAVMSVVVGVIWATMVGGLWWVVGGSLFALSLLAIWLRGYLVPGTPQFTKRYFPDWLLAKFDKAPQPGATAGGFEWEDSGPERGGGGQSGQSARTASGMDGNGGGARAEASKVEAGDEPTAGANGAVASAGEATGDETDDGSDEQPRFVDPEEALLSAGVVEPCDEYDDLCLTDSFEGEWLTRVRDLRDLPNLERVRGDLAGALGIEDLSVDRDGHDRPVATARGEKIHAWVSDGALVGDLAALGVLTERVDDWETVPVPQRVGIARALRSFYSTCPLCEGFVAASEDTVESCCRSWDVIAIRCTECDEHLLELDPRQFGDPDSDERTSPTEGGFTR